MTHKPQKKPENWPKFSSFWKHVKTGKIYVVCDYVYIEETASPAVVYFEPGIEDQVKWVRPLDEFLDGRFKKEFD